MYRIIVIVGIEASDFRKVFEAQTFNRGTKEVLDYARNHTTERVQKVVLKFAVGKKQIANLLKNDAKIRLSEIRGINKRARSGE